MLEIEIRAGLHTGECELSDGKITGIAVSIPTRISSLATPHGVLISSTVRDLIATQVSSSRIAENTNSKASPRHGDSSPPPASAFHMEVAGIEPASQPLVARR